MSNSAPPNDGHSESRARRAVKRALLTLACGYPLALLSLTLGFYLVGERWWLTAAGLYLPRLPLALPLPLFAVLLWRAGFRRYGWTQLIGLLLLVPLLGLVAPVPLPAVPRADAPTLKVLSLNVNSGAAGPGPIVDAIGKFSPDVVLLQEVYGEVPLLEALRARYPHVRSSSQFIVASRSPITASSASEGASVFDPTLPRFVRYVIDTPLGSIAFFDMHPVSPRGVMGLYRTHQTLHQLRTGELFGDAARRDVEQNAAQRASQVAAAALGAQHDELPVVIAGDTNLPHLSAVFRQYLSHFTDGFRAASWGLGYTYPDKHPFLRLDRILASDRLRFVSFRVGCSGISDHRCVVAELQATP